MKKMFMAVLIGLLAACNTTPPEEQPHAHDGITPQLAAGSTFELYHLSLGPDFNGHRALTRAKTISTMLPPASYIPWGSSFEIDLTAYHYVANTRISITPNSFLYPISCTWLNKTTTTPAYGSKISCGNANKPNALYTIKVDELNSAGTWVNVVTDSYTTTASNQ